MEETRLAAAPDAVMHKGSGILAIYRGSVQVWSASYITVSFNANVIGAKITCYGGSGKADVPVTGGVPAILGPGRTRLYLGTGSSTTSIDMTGFDASAIQRYDGMFSGLDSLESLLPPKTKSPEVKEIYNMFTTCASLRAVSLTFLEDCSLTRIESLFSGCTSLAEVDFGLIDPATITSWSNAFKNCSSLAKIRCTAKMRTFLRNKRVDTGLSKTPFDFDAGFIDAATTPPLRP
ncbi:MAG: leucine-rich repeat domain-containing protein [Muribaculaceae bacterium]|nr:leucine-rich repeat domain-containing protein [Muribaculaceae bacterium]